MYTASESIDFSYGHRLRGHEGKCAHLHGHNGRAEIVLEADDLDGRSMVEDFDRIGSVIREWLEANLDHRMILQSGDPLVEQLRAMGEPVFTMEASPTAEALARLIFDAAMERGLPVAEVRLHETGSSIASYRPRT